jgi:hypothetical protein
MSYEKHATALINCFIITVHAYTALLLVDVALSWITLFAKSLPPVDATTFLFNVYFGILTCGMISAAARIFYHLFFQEAILNQGIEMYKAMLNQPIISHVLGNKEGTFTRINTYANDIAKLVMNRIYKEDDTTEEENTTEEEDTTKKTEATDKKTATSAASEPVTPDSASAKSNAETETYTDAKMAKMAKGPEADGEIKKAD